ncbi:MAG: hypothetical protein WCI03_06760 [bacterium]|jgi:hypothetical protein
MQNESPVMSAVAAFDAAVRVGRVGQAYLVIGNLREEAIPFTEAALQQLFCQGMVKPCGDCVACQQIHDHKHIDVVWIEPEKKSRVVGVDRIRDLQRVIYQTSYSGGWKAVVFVGADRIGEEAANSFLKTLEEPPARCVFFLLTDTPQAILPTILSRCQRLLLSSESEVLAEPWRGALLEILATPLGGGLIGRLARSTRLDILLSDIKKTVDKEEKRRYQEEQEALRNPDEKIKATKAKDVILEARIEARFRGLRAMVLRAMLFWYRDLLVAVTVSSAQPPQLRYPDQAAVILGIAQGLSFADAMGNVRVVEAMQRQFDRNLPSGLVLTGAVNGLSA